MTSPRIVKADLVADLTYRKQLATAEDTAAAAAVTALSSPTADARYAALRRRRIAATRLDQLTQELIFANQLA